MALIRKVPCVRQYNSPLVLACTSSSLVQPALAMSSDETGHGDESSSIGPLTWRLVYCSFSFASIRLMQFRLALLTKPLCIVHQVLTVLLTGTGHRGHSINCLFQLSWIVLIDFSTDIIIITYRCCCHQHELSWYHDCGSDCSRFQESNTERPITLTQSLETVHDRRAN